MRKKHERLLRQDLDDALSRLNRLEIRFLELQERNGALEERLARVAGRLGAPKKPAPAPAIPLFGINPPTM